MNQKINPQHSVGQLVTESPSRSRVFENLKIDYCCGGKIPLVEACQKRGLEVESVVAMLDQADADSAGITAEKIDPDSMSLTELADHIENVHHAYLWSELPRLDQITDRVNRVHGDKDPRLGTVRTAFSDLQGEMLNHMMKEEQILFPMIRGIESGGAPGAGLRGSISIPIQEMEAEHEHAGDALSIMREATDGFQPPEWACNTYRAMLDGLAVLERDLHQHVHKENNVLFPKAIGLEQRMVGA